MVEQRDGNAIAAERASKAVQQEAEAWKIAQLAATLMAGSYAAGNSLGPETATHRAIGILEAARQKAAC